MNEKIIEIILALSYLSFSLVLNYNYNTIMPTTSIEWINMKMTYIINSLKNILLAYNSHLSYKNIRKINISKNNQKLV